MHTRIILTALVLAQLADAATFTLGEALHGIGIESNGLARLVYHAGGLDGILMLKGAVILGTLAILLLTSRRLPRLFVWGAAAGTSIGLLGALVNVWSLVLLAG